MRIAEIYKSTQGEGRLTGADSVFVRASGCNLRCGFCDTPYASWHPEGEDLSVEEIVQRTLVENCRHVVLTGGEPMLFAELLPLCERLRAADRHLTIETAGTLYLPVACDLMSISPKLENSAPGAEIGEAWKRRHEQTRHAPDVMRRLLAEYDCQLKFVIASEADCDEVQRYLQQFPTVACDQVWLMPEGVCPQRLEATAAWLEPFCRQAGYQFCPRKQIEWFGSERGT